MNHLNNKTIVLGIGGGIAAYKSCELTRLLVQEGANVHVILTEAAKQFITPLTLQTLSKNPVHTNLFDLSENPLTHIHLADEASYVIIAPATADLIARIALGFANDLLTCVLLATRAPVIVFPSMNVQMWEHPATQSNVKRLKELGYFVTDPEEGDLVCGYAGKGRLMEPEQILQVIKTIPHIQTQNAAC